MGDFTAYFLIARDGMRSRSCRAFLRSFAGSITGKDWVFKLTIADKNNPDHAIIFEDFNEEALVEFQEARGFDGSLEL